MVEPEVPGIDATEGPPDEADWSLGALGEILHCLRKSGHDILARPEVASESPAPHVVAESAQEPSQLRRAAVRGQQAGKDEHPMAITMWRTPQQRQRNREQDRVSEATERLGNIERRGGNLAHPLQVEGHLLGRRVRH